MVVESVPALFVVSISLPPLTVASAVFGVVAAPSTAVVTVSAADPPAAIAVVRVHVTTWAAVLHVHPVPAPTGVLSPDCSVAVAVIVPVEAVLPLFVTVNV